MKLKRIKNYLPAVLVCSTLVGCKATPLPPPQVLSNMESFEVILPNDVVGNTKTWNVNFRPFQNGSREQGSNIYNYFSVDYTANTQTSELDISACNGERYPNGTDYKSCASYLADVTVTKKENHKILTITPKLKSLSRGGFLIFKPIPKMTIDKLYGYLSRQEITFKGNITSKFNTESIKGNFDRLMTRHSWRAGQADAAHRQFKDTYTLTLSTGEQVVISAGFYPYRDGSIVEYVVNSITQNDPSVRQVDWVKTSEEVKKHIEKVVNS
ncbi:hypothetical protein L1285_08280 [Pseudoalteromonas sp. DL2-H2.2]|uniref:hypothetical protein n=1 Tax=Pseudoalteromonas sp. DL2-H2.2 TaxID=2908889 RepID=UPI001F1D0B7F|nr:hypothetical protein [Pseudoalteromonas sp. DL2-H2.2]MCF2908318.1 hypothetical protein [Pseudoalteromonas sp. DL2-H2.2]